jgi:2-C-methyl-D-erythritol 4-phosphate cytidylyltransferase
LIGLILAAAGSGTRFGASVPKQFVSLDGVPVYLRALTAFQPHVSETIVVVPALWREQVTRELAGYAGRICVHAGGPKRQDSVWLGLQQLSGEVKTVLVHDAARPFVSSALIRRVLDAARRSGAAIPGLPVSETVKAVEGGRVVQTLDRTRLVLVQTPQAFARSLLAQAFERAVAEGVYATDEASLVERMGAAVTVVEGEPGNVKITWKEDLESR